MRKQWLLLIATALTFSRSVAGSGGAVDCTAAPSSAAPT